MRHPIFSTTVLRKAQPPFYRFHAKAYDQVQGIFIVRGCLHVREHESEEIHELPAGAFVILREKGAFTLFCSGEGYEGIGVVMQGKTQPSLTGRPLAGVSDSRLRMLEGLVTRHMDAPLPESAQVLPLLGEALIWEALILFRERRSPRGSDWAEAARTAIELNMGTGIPLREALASLPLSYRQAARCFQDRFGVSPKEFQDLLRVHEVCRLLVSTQMDVTSIANELGFSSSQHLATRFQRKIGTTPSAYRREHCERNRASPKVRLLQNLSHRNGGRGLPPSIREKSPDFNAGGSRASATAEVLQEPQVLWQNSEREEKD